MAAAQKSEPRVRQVITPRSSKRAAKSRSRRKSAININGLLHGAVLFAKPAAILLVVVLVAVGFNAMAGSGIFELQKVEVIDASPALRAEVEQLVRRSAGQASLLKMDLKSIKQKVEALPRVRQAAVTRILPDGVAIRVVERQPFVLVRRESSALVWLDSDGVEIGEMSEMPAGARAEVPPTVKGFSEGSRTKAAIDEDRERLNIYRQIEHDFKEGPDPIWNLVDEIDLTFTRSVNLRLVNSPVTVVVGSKDFRNRFGTALQILNAIKEGDSDLIARFRVQDAERLIENQDRINFIDTSRSDRVVLNFSTPGTEKSVRQEPKNR